MRPITTAKTLETIAVGFELANTNNKTKVTGITHDSRAVLPGDIYVALPGANHHGIEFAQQALASGAVAIASDEFGLTQLVDPEIPKIKLTNPRAEMATLAARVYDHPQEKLTLVGVTGTNGKTSVTHMLQSVFTNFGFKVGVIGTIGTYLAGKHLPGVRTTPESTDLYAILAMMVQEDITHVFMEVSSHALEMDRVAGLTFNEAVFTNLSQDHLDFHGSMENYFAAKAKLFTDSYTKHAVICTFDNWGARLAEETKVPKATVGPDSDWQISDLHLSVSATEFNLNHELTSVPCSIPMLGQFNAANAAVTVAVATSLGLDPQLVARDLTNIDSVPGRSQVVTHNSPGTAIVDYAHTPEAVEKVLLTLREVCQGQLITVLGCGGDRDRAKRPLMGGIAAKISDVVIITDDNPRSEDPAQIRKEVLSGISADLATEIIEIGDRREAIRAALAKASHADVIAVLGKGHEHGQEIAGQILPFDDVQVIQVEAQHV